MLCYFPLALVITSIAIRVMMTIIILQFQSPRCGPSLKDAPFEKTVYGRWKNKVLHIFSIGFMRLPKRNSRSIKLCETRNELFSGATLTPCLQESGRVHHHPLNSLFADFAEKCYCVMCEPGLLKIWWNESCTSGMFSTHKLEKCVLPPNTD